uniref:FLYWCH-type domain-containing protein n=2 Tax=Anopheles albimanus TaxID=7167 RepID=A0A182FXA5_ANOAL
MSLVLNGYTFEKEKTRKTSSSWRCTQAKVYRCKARIVEQHSYDKDDSRRFQIVRSNHNHAIVSKRRPRGSLNGLRKAKESIIKRYAKQSKASKRIELLNKFEDDYTKY